MWLKIVPWTCFTDNWLPLQSQGYEYLTSAVAKVIELEQLNDFLAKLHSTVQGLQDSKLNQQLKPNSTSFNCQSMQLEIVSCLRWQMIHFLWQGQCSFAWSRRRPNIFGSISHSWLEISYANKHQSWLHWISRGRTLNNLYISKYWGNMKVFMW